MRGSIGVLIVLCCLLGSDTPVLAQPTQRDVLRSIGEHIDGQKRDSGRTMALVAAAGGLALLMVVLAQVRKREVAPKVLNHHGKLLKEIARGLGLKKSELRQLKILADQQGISSPVTLLLCPSLLSRSLESADAKVDRRVVSSIVRRVADASSSA